MKPTGHEAQVMKPSRERGVALLTALMVLALASLLAYGLIEQGRLALDRASGKQRAAQASALADGIFDYALIALLRDQAESSTDHNEEVWAKPLPPLPVLNGVVTGVMTDLNGRINVNGFAATRQDQRDFTRTTLTQLLVNLAMNPQIAGRIEDAIDADDASLGGGEDVDYMAARPSARAPNRTLLDISELRALPGLSSTEFAQLEPFLCAIDKEATLNINTASWQVLMSLDKNISEDLAKKLWREGRANFSDKSIFVQEVFQGANLTLSDKVQNNIDFKSSYFIVRARIKLDGIEYRHRALLNRSESEVVWRVQGDG
jgi:general secretion pathway protein K